MTHARHQWFCFLSVALSLQSRQERTEVLTSVFSSFTKPEYFQVHHRPEHSIQAAAAPAVGFVRFQKTVCRNLAVCEDTDIRRHNSDMKHRRKKRASRLTAAEGWISNTGGGERDPTSPASTDSPKVENPTEVWKDARTTNTHMRESASVGGSFHTCHRAELYMLV